MGTDVSLLVEANLSGHWRGLLLPIWHNFRTDEQCTLVPTLSRNYALFSVLADVRNRSGRGTQTPIEIVSPDGETFNAIYDTDDGNHHPLIPIDNPRGVPDDASEIWKRWYDHSHAANGVHDWSYLGLPELLDGPWDQPVMMDTVISEQDYKDLRDHGIKPDTFAAGAEGNGLRTVTAAEYEAGERGERTTAVRAEFQAGTARDHAQELFRILEIAKVVAPGDDFHNIRIMMSFDS